MGRPKKTDGEVTTETKVSEGVPEIQKDGTAGNPPAEGKKRGRPPGSKNGKKTKVPVAKPPKEILDAMALAPISIANVVLMKSKGIVLVMNPESVANIPIAFGAWLESMELEITPGWALLAAYGMAFGTATTMEVPKDAKPRDGANLATELRTVANQLDPKKEDKPNGANVSNGSAEQATA